ncbi:unnamed protein product [Calypogeia fissa]
MEFSDTYKHSGPCFFSPDARFLAVAVDYRLVIRDVISLKVVQLYSCLDKISHVEWAPDSEYLLCALYKKGIVQAWSVSDPDWTCKIDEGAAGLTHARWSPDSRHILTTSEFLLRLTVWSLVSKACFHIQWPKHASRGCSFTPDGKYAAIATRKDCKDYLNLLSCLSWEALGTFETETVDLVDVEWSPTDSTIAVWDSPLDYKVLIYSPDGRCLFKYSAYENALGIKTVSWSPCGQFLGVGSYDQTLRALNHLTGRPVAEFTHPTAVKGPYNAVVFKEISEPVHLDMAKLRINGKRPEDSPRAKVDRAGSKDPEKHIEGPTRTHYEVVDFPVTMKSEKPQPDKPNPKQGVGLLSWSPDSCFILTRNDNMANALWIWDVAHLELAAVLLQKEPIRAAAWDPMQTRLALCTGSSSLYMWTPAGACCVNIPLPQFAATDLKWNPDGTSLLLKDKDSFCCTFVPTIDDFEAAGSQ